jgi:hypothetical protein
MKKKQMAIRWMRVAVLLGVFVLALFGCKKKVVEETATILPEKQKVTDEVKVEETIPETQNLLTGLLDLSEEAIGKRPVAVMINNVQKALPQYGVGDADLIFEIPVEGDVTRLMALYADYTKVPYICAVRSCRSYFPSFSQGFDAFYVNWGIDESVADYLASLNLDQYDGIVNASGLFGRDQGRLSSGYSLEHTGYFDGTRFAETVQAEGKRLELKEELSGPAFSFYGLDEQVAPEGEDCTTVTVAFGAATSTFTYDEETKTYLKQFNGQAHIDGISNEQLAFTNVVVLETDISVRDDEGHKEINWRGGDNYVGYYISNGAVQEIRWCKENNSESGRLLLKDLNGEEIRINRGKTYIAVNYKGQCQTSK